MHACALVCMHACTHARAHTHTHTYTHTHMHAYTHTLVQLSVLKLQILGAGETLLSCNESKSSIELWLSLLLWNEITLHETRLT